MKGGTERDERREIEKERETKRTDWQRQTFSIQDIKTLTIFGTV